MGNDLPPCTTTSSVIVWTIMSAKPRKKTPMSDDHKAALAKGREEGRAVRRYLEALEASRPKRGRRRTPESIKKRLAAIDDQIATENAINRLQLVQERIDLTAELEASDDAIDIADLEKDFVAAARGYSERKGISYAAWRELGVPASVLSDAGISRSTR
jgi:hypothetical protein